MIVRARAVVTMDGPPIENGAVAISGDRIADVGTFPEIKARHSGEEILDLGEQVLLPGLINAHCHLDYTRLRGKIPPPESFADWVRAINSEKADLSAKDYVVSINTGFAEAKRFGTTTMANLTAFPELITKVRAPIRTWWFAELIDVRNPRRANEIVDLAIESSKTAAHWGLAPHALFTASANLFRRCEEVAREKNVLLTTHLAESREEMSMFRDAAGPLYEFLKEFGRDMSDCGRGTPLKEFVGRLRHGESLIGETSLPGNWIVAHLNDLAESDFHLLARFPTKFHIVHCPRSHEYFAHSRFQFERLRELGFNICLGTDSLASNDDLSLFAEMRAFQQESPGVPPEEIFTMVTTNAARALGQRNTLGKIHPGFCADLIAIPVAPSTGPGRVFEEILAFEQPIDWMLSGGNE
jgi:cytosine/adenosine deaminase-related metal-dependent hydrolase